jgi:HEPN domain-containing protein
MDAKLSLVRKWVLKARRDLLSPKKLAKGKEAYLDTAIYHCQQSAEKVIKGWMVYRDISFEKTHDLRLLVTLAAEAEASFESWLDIAARLSPYATAYRYPGEELEPTEREFAGAFNTASSLYEFVCTLLPPDVTVP